MQVVLLAAGKGRRLGSLTKHRSKAMMPVLGKPIVERVMEPLVANGLHEFILVVSSNDRDIQSYFRDRSKLDIEIRFVYQHEQLGMAHALLQAAPLLESDFVLSACDNLLSAQDVGSLMAAWGEVPHANALLSLMAMPNQNLQQSSSVSLEGPWVQRIVEKPDPEELLSNLGCLSFYIFSHGILDFLPEVKLSRRGEYEIQSAIQALIDRKGRVLGSEVDGRMSLSKPDDLLAINHHFLRRQGGVHVDSAAIGRAIRFIDPVVVERDVLVGVNCVIGPNVYLESGCQIGDRVVLQDAVVLRSGVVPGDSSRSGEVIAWGPGNYK